tara:strand:+ start:8877 stop:9416 length:540 start_codon:yes stop_codon:yes gene_type:complete
MHDFTTPSQEEEKLTPIMVMIHLKSGIDIVAKALGLLKGAHVPTELYADRYDGNIDEYLLRDVMKIEYPSTFSGEKFVLLYPWFNFYEYMQLSRDEIVAMAPLSKEREDYYLGAIERTKELNKEEAIRRSTNPNETPPQGGDEEGLASPEDVRSATQDEILKRAFNMWEPTDEQKKRGN